MKNFKTVFTILFLICFGIFNAQKVGVVDTDVILEKLPQYKEAEAKLNSQIDTWQTDLQNLQAEYEKRDLLLKTKKFC